MPIETIIFDMDGVIVDTEPIHWKIERQMFRELEIDVSEAQHQSFIGRSTLEMWEDVVDTFHLADDPHRLTQDKDHRFEVYIRKHGASLMPGIDSFMTAILSKQKKLAIASSSNRRQIDIVVEQLKINPDQFVIVSGAELPKSKPDPLIFLNAAKLTGSKTNECCVIEDSYNGILAAHRAGMRSIAYRNKHNHHQDLSLATESIKDYNLNNIAVLGI